MVVDVDFCFGPAVCSYSPAGLLRLLVALDAADTVSVTPSHPVDFAPILLHWF